jgi:hypothetical protein
MQLTRSRARVACVCVLFFGNVFLAPVAHAADQEGAGDQVAARKEDKAQQAAAEGKAP